MADVRHPCFWSTWSNDGDDKDALKPTGTLFDDGMMGGRQCS